MDLPSVALIWPHVATLCLLVALAWYSWRRRDVPGARPLVAACLFQALWMIGAAAESVAQDVPAKIAWFQFQAVWKGPTVTAGTCFALEYVYPGRWLTRRRLILLSIVPLLVLLLTLTNDLHGWYWPAFVYDGSVKPTRSVLNWITNAYGMGLVLVNTTAFAWLFVRSPQHRWPIALMVAGQLAGRVFYAMDLGAGNAIIRPDPIILSVVISTAAYAIALFAFRILDPLPTARRIAIEQMQDGMLVFDARWQAVGLNPAAERILGMPAARVRGKTWPQLLPSYPDPEQCAVPGAGLVEISLGTGADVRHYAPVLSGLQDHRGLTTGHLLLLRDVTEQRRARAQLLEQQWAEATMQERELLAQELHDGLAQHLGFLNLQAQAACLYLQAGQGQATRDSLDRLAAVALEMQDETRKLIGDLLAVSLPFEGLCGAVRRAVTRFEEQTGLRTCLEIADELQAVCSPEVLPPATGVQVLRILQEALANVRKHAGSPSQVDVTLKADDQELRITVADNGAGFDPALAGTGGNHFGLQVMEQRARRIGGQLTLHAVPGQGTCVEVRVPLGS